MTEFGEGPRFALYSAIYFAAVFALDRLLSPLFAITVLSRQVAVVAGTLLILCGIPFYILSVANVLRAFKAKRLLTSGTYGMCRHPVYSAWIVFFVPGISLLLNSWALLSASLVMCLIASALVRSEDAYLEHTFGEEYLSYKRKVPAIIPYGWLKRG
jgi:protein-S-isoprenylcysteine O-methyltransferase Ste14